MPTWAPTWLHFRGPGASCGTLGLSWAALGASWGRLGIILVTSGGVLGRLGQGPKRMEKTDGKNTKMWRPWGRDLRTGQRRPGSWDPLNDNFQRKQHHNPQDNRTIQHAQRAEARWRIRIFYTITETPMKK